MHTCIKCNQVTEEPNDKFCYSCIAKRAFQMYIRLERRDKLYNWFQAIEELTYETK